MRPETILQSDLLDILFENRNKEYGAYALRKDYNKRLIKALSGTCILVLLFVVLQSMKPVDDTMPPLIPPETTLIDVPLIDPAKPDEEKPKAMAVRKEKGKTLTDFVPTIKPDDTVPETTVNTNEDIYNNAVGGKPSEGESGTPGDLFEHTPSPGTGEHKPAETAVFDDVTVREFADVMPSFNGDIVRFMLKNLRQPADLEEGQKIVVRVRFVVNTNGEIEEVKVVQSGRTDLDNEVARVVKKMPRWKPGMQGGRNVPVYFYLPVTFVGNSE